MAAGSLSAGAGEGKSLATEGALSDDAWRTHREADSAPSSFLLAKKAAFGTAERGAKSLPIYSRGISTTFDTCCQQALSAQVQVRVPSDTLGAGNRFHSASEGEKSHFAPPGAICAAAVLTWHARSFAPLASAMGSTPCLLYTSPSPRDS